MPVHAEAQQLLAALEAAGLPPFEHMTGALVAHDEPGDRGRLSGAGRASYDQPAAGRERVAVEHDNRHLADLLATEV